MMSEMFVGGMPDTEDERTCGNCGERKPISEFYKDGTDGNGNVRYRRDCKMCYRITRLKSRRAKRAVEKKATAPPPRKKGRRT